MEDLPGYVRETTPLALFTRLQRVGLHLQALQDEAMADIGLSFADYTVLATLHREGPPHALPVSRLAELVVRPMGSMTQVIDRLAAAGVVTRHFDAGDRRRVLVELTGDGVSLAERGDKAYRTIRERILEQLGPSEQVEIDAAITRLLDVVEADQTARN